MAQRNPGASNAEQLAALRQASTKGEGSIVNGIAHQVSALSAPPEKGSLDIGPMEWRKISALKKSPYNEVFQHLKTPDYMAALTEDILKAREITDALVITPDNVLISGHSRLDIALSLFRAGYKQFEKVPVRVIATPLSEEERKERVYLANLSRFEINKDTRLLLYAEIWPEFYNQNLTAGRPKREDTNIPTVAEMADKTGVTPRQVQRDAQVIREAKGKAEEEGRPVNVSDISASREQLNQERKEREKQTVEAQEPPEVAVAAETNPEEHVVTDLPGSMDNEILSDKEEPISRGDEEIATEEVVPGSMDNEEVLSNKEELGSRDWVKETNNIPRGEQWLRSIDELDSILKQLRVCEDFWLQYNEGPMRDPNVESKREALTRIKNSLESLINGIREEK